MHKRLFSKKIRQILINPTLLPYLIPEVVSKNLKQSRIQVGEAYESIFTPSVLASIDAVMIPEFIKGDYYTGVLKALEKINELIK